MADDTADISLKSFKRTRAPNFTQSERNVFLYLSRDPKFKEGLENKKSDGQSRLQKAKCWSEFCTEFNSLSVRHHRSEESLKALWDNIRRTPRKAQDIEPNETFINEGDGCLNESDSLQSLPDTSPPRLKRSNTSEPEDEKATKRQRLFLNSDHKNIDLIAAKLELTLLTKQQLLKEEKRRLIMFELDRKKKEVEIQLMQLQILKIKQDLNFGNTSM